MSSKRAAQEATDEVERPPKRVSSSRSTAASRTPSPEPYQSHREVTEGRPHRPITRQYSALLTSSQSVSSTFDSSIDDELSSLPPSPAAIPIEPRPIIPNTVLDTLGIPSPLQRRFPSPSDIEIVQQIHLVQLRTQVNFMPPPSYFSVQRDVDSVMRATLVDWLVEVVESCNLSQSSLFLTVSIVDRYLGLQPVRREGFQLLFIAALWIATKFFGDLIYVDALTFISRNTYSVAEIVGMEKTIFIQLNQRINTPTVLSFLERYLAMTAIDVEAVQLCHYLAELSLLDHSLVRFRPSVVAAAAVSLSLHACGCHAWTSHLIRYASCSNVELVDCMTDLLVDFSEAPLSRFNSIRSKYLVPNPRLCVAQIPAPDSIPCC